MVIEIWEEWFIWGRVCEGRMTRGVGLRFCDFLELGDVGGGVGEGVVWEVGGDVRGDGEVEGGGRLKEEVGIIYGRDGILCIEELERCFFF